MWFFYYFEVQRIAIIDFYSNKLVSYLFARHRKSTPEELIRSETKISHHHLTPEIALHLITDECRLYHQRLDNGPSGDKALEAFGQEPYWAFYWPDGQALTK